MTSLPRFQSIPGITKLAETAKTTLLLQPARTMRAPVALSTLKSLLIDPVPVC
jgi:hypothetical protein